MNPKSNRAIVREMFEAGATDVEIADRLDCPLGSVSSTRSKLGLLRPKPPFWTAEKDALLSELLPTDTTYAEIAAALGCSKSMLARHLTILGIQRRKPRPIVTAAIQPGLALSPAMRHLAKFDSVIAARVEREGEGQ